LKRRKKVTREITIETTETILTRDGSSITASNCNQCGEGSRLVSFAEAVSTFGMDALTLHRWLNEGLVHFQVSETVGLAICWNTLSTLPAKHPEISNGSSGYGPEGPTPMEKRIDHVRAKETRGHGSRKSP
jgi:hypothetical protein